MTARPMRCRRRPIPTSSTTTRTLLEKLGVKLPDNAQLTQAAVPRPRQEGARRRHHADCPGRRRPAVSRRLYRRRGAAAQARPRRLSASCSTASCRSRIPRVVEVFNWVKELVDAGAYPKNFMTLKLGESHSLLLPEAGRADVADGQLLYRPRLRAGRQGRPAADFPLGIMQFPAMDKARLQRMQDRRRSARASPSTPRASTRSWQPTILNEMSTPEMGKMWIETVYLQTAVKTGRDGVQRSLCRLFHRADGAPEGCQILHRQPRRHPDRRVQGRLRPGDELRRFPAA